jgi:hypothetical protein
MPKFVGIRERRHHEVSFRFNTDAWAFQYGLAMRALADFQADPTKAPWDFLEDIAIGLSHAGMGNDRVEELLKRTRARDLSAMDLLPDREVRLQSGGVKVVNTSSLILAGMTVGSEVGPSTSYVTLDNAGSDRAEASVSLNSLAALCRVGQIVDQHLGDEPNTKVVGCAQLVHRFQQPVILPQHSTFNMSLHVRDAVPAGDLIITLVGMSIQEVM